MDDATTKSSYYTHAHTHTHTHRGFHISYFSEVFNYILTGRIKFEFLCRTSKALQNVILFTFLDLFPRPTIIHQPVPPTRWLAVFMFSYLSAPLTLTLTLTLTLHCYNFPHLPMFVYFTMPIINMDSSFLKKKKKSHSNNSLTFPRWKNLILSLNRIYSVEHFRWSIFTSYLAAYMQVFYLLNWKVSSSRSRTMFGVSFFQPNNNFAYFT